MLVLAVAKGFVMRLMWKAAVRAYLVRHRAHLLTELTTVMEAVGSEGRRTECE